MSCTICSHLDDNFFSTSYKAETAGNPWVQKLRPPSSFRADTQHQFDRNLLTIICYQKTGIAIVLLFLHFVQGTLSICNTVVNKWFKLAEKLSTVLDKELHRTLSFLSWRVWRDSGTLFVKKHGCRPAASASESVKPPACVTSSEHALHMACPVSLPSVYAFIKQTLP